MTIGEEIKAERIKLGLSQKKLGELCEPPIDAAHIRRIENNRTSPTVETIQRIGTALGKCVSMNYINDLHENAKASNSVKNKLLEKHLADLQFYGEIRRQRVESEAEFLDFLCNREGMKKPEIKNKKYTIYENQSEYQFDIAEWSKFCERATEHVLIDFRAFLEERGINGSKEENND